MVDEPEKYDVPKVDIKQLLEAGVHRPQDTKMESKTRNIFWRENSIHIIDLTQMVEFSKTL